MNGLVCDISIILRAIRENVNFRRDLSRIAPEIEDKLYSFYNNSNCSCRSTIESWITTHTDKINKLAESYRSDFQTIQDEIAKSLKHSNTNVSPEMNRPTSISGHIYVIPQDDKKYNELINNLVLSKKGFRGLNVVESVVDNQPVWKIFFY